MHGYPRQCRHLANACKFNNAKFPRKFELISVKGHPRSSTLVPIESVFCNFLLIVNSNFGRISYRFRDIEKYYVFPAHPCLNLVHLELVPFDPRPRKPWTRTERGLDRMHRLRDTGCRTWCHFGSIELYSQWRESIHACRQRANQTMNVCRMLRYWPVKTAFYIVVWWFNISQLRCGLLCSRKRSWVVSETFRCPLQVSWRRDVVYLWTTTARWWRRRRRLHHTMVWCQPQQSRNYWQGGSEVNFSSLSDKFDPAKWICLM